ncbi:class I SAM-dependent methyltransferase [Streptomyces triticiradicis]|uniref:Methyltransferase domain-containing protein n=1 Tax=Streptomyces triticiradicis TaxID=2651189 RepID=A0A7J5DD53_9ACTN|nr:methyltransferase domain-containing protein [Streptomyces triticiradicis]KAB1985765.1 methyltransferase domain-containing protein [Streptomyces triticiradicis]
MHELVNTAQSQAWNGDEGRHWSDHHDRWNAVNEGFDEPLLAAAGIGPEDRVLDVGCGTGQTTRLAARTAARGSALGLDLSGPMLDRARGLAAEEGLGNIGFEQGDAQVHPLPGAAFDVALSRFGIMFFADPAAAFGNIARALRPGGRLAFVCVADPARCEWAQVYGAASAALPSPPQASGASAGPGMFSLADPVVVREVLTKAGFDGVRTEAVDALGNFGRDADAAAEHLLGSGPGRHLVELLGSAGDGDGASRVRAALSAALTPYEQEPGVLMRTGAWLVTAVRR